MASSAQCLPPPADAQEPSPYVRPAPNSAPPAASDAAPSGFRKRSRAARYRRAVNNAGKWWECRAAALSPMALRYALYGRTEAWLGVSVSLPVTEEQVPEADRHFHARLLRALCPVWPTASVEHARDKKGAHLGRRQLWLPPGGRADRSTRITISPTMFHTAHQRFTLSAGAECPVAALGPWQRRP